MSEEIIKRNENGDIIYYKSSSSRENIKYEYWKKYDENNNIIHYKSVNGFEYWSEYDGNNEIHCWNNEGDEVWYKQDENNCRVEITKQEFERIERVKAEQEFLSRDPISRFELIEL